MKDTSVLKKINKVINADRPLGIFAPQLGKKDMFVIGNASF